MPGANPQGQIPAEREWVFLVVVPGILLLFVVGPLASAVGSTLLHDLLYAFLSLCIFAGIWAYSPSRRVVATGAVLLVLNWIGRLGESTTDDEAEFARFVLAEVTGAPLVLLSIVVQIAYLFRARSVTPAHLSSAVFAYVLLALLWGYAYKLASLVEPASFAGVSDPPRFHEFLYFSFVTVTTLGYGDIAPRSDLARSLAMLEALVGQVFLAVFVAHLVSLNIVRRTSGDPRC